MRKKAPGERYKTLTASIPPELYDAFVSRADQDRINKSELVKSWVEAWLSGSPIQSGEPSPSPAINLEQLKQEIKEELKPEIKTDVLNSLVTVSPEPKPEVEQEAEARKVTPEQAQLTITPPEPEPVKPVRQSKPEKIQITEEVRAGLISHFELLKAAGMKDADITRAAFGKKTSLVSLIKYEMDNPKRQKAVTKEQYDALMAVVPPGTEKPSPEGT